MKETKTNAGQLTSIDPAHESLQRPSGTERVEKFARLVAKGLMRAHEKTKVTTQQEEK